MSRYNVGDKVIVREPEGGHYNFIDDMKKYDNTVMTISYDDKIGYFMVEDKPDGFGGWFWNDEFIVGLAEEGVK